MNKRRLIVNTRKKLAIAKHNRKMREITKVISEIFAYSHVAIETLTKNLHNARRRFDERKLSSGATTCVPPDMWLLPKLQEVLARSMRIQQK
ncbi:MAG: hypothetical protein E6713_06145 [Sporomusaceae bacterium]|nr:hypothetical protein [Sporomusaceae bacterium]